MIGYCSLHLYYGNNKEVIHGYYPFFKRHDEPFPSIPGE